MPHRGTVSTLSTLALGLGLALATLLSGCGGSGPLGLGAKEAPGKGSSEEPREAGGGGVGGGPIDPAAVEAAYATYRKAYIFWNAEEKSFREGIEGNPVLMNGAYGRMKNHLAVMDRYLAGQAKELFASFVRRYGSAYQSLAQGQMGRGVQNEIRVLGERVRSEFNPAAVDLVAPVVEGPVYVAAAEPPAEPRKKIPAAPLPPAGPGEDAKAEPEPAPAPVPEEPERIQVTTAYREAWHAWQLAHRTMVDSLFGEKPDLKAHYDTAAGRLVSVQGELPAGAARRLQALLEDYARAYQLSAEGATARRLINQFRLVAGEIEKIFDPAVLSPSAEPGAGSSGGSPETGAEPPK